MGEADRFGVVRLLGVAQRAAEQRDRARLIAFGKGDAPVKAPQRGEQRGRQIVARRVRRTSQRRRRLDEVVAHQPRFGERASQADFVLVLQPEDFSACVSTPIASACRPRSSAARARASAG